jgi:hypothetical protein
MLSPVGPVGPVGPAVFSKQQQQPCQPTDTHVHATSCFTHAPLAMVNSLNCWLLCTDCSPTSVTSPCALTGHQMHLTDLSSQFNSSATSVELSAMPIQQQGKYCHTINRLRVQTLQDCLQGTLDASLFEELAVTAVPVGPVGPAVQINSSKSGD